MARYLRSILGVVAVVAAAAAVVTVVQESPVPVVTPPLTRAAPDARTAFAVARQQGARVEVYGERTATDTVWANPDGTRTLEIGVVPQRVRRGDEWVPVDTTLTTKPGGGVAPAAAGDLTFSGGGADAPMVRIGQDGAELALYWPDALPRPRLSKNEARYADVLPGVDLVLRAEKTGYRQLFVVGDAAAARNPRLANLRLRVAAKGLTVTAGEQGTLTAVNTVGEQVFSAPPSVMWDATARHARVGLAIAGDTMTLTPDQAFLADPATRYPVTVDPDVTYGKNAWATVLGGRDFQNNSYWWTSGDGVNAQVGQCYPSASCNGIGEARAYFRFVADLPAGARVKSAAFRSTVAYSPNCDGVGQTHLLHRIDGTFESNLTWNNMPQSTFGAPFGAPKVNGNYGCGGNKGVGIPVNVTPNGMNTFYLRADNGGDGMAWRKYLPGETVLSVVYNRPPNAPYNPRTDPPQSDPCRWCGATRYVADQNLRLVASLSDPDGDSVQPKWRINRNGVVENRDGAFQASGATHDTNVAITDAMHGQWLGWWVDAFDGQDGSASTGGQTVTIDRKPPGAPPKVSSKAYPSTNDWYGGRGVVGDFTFAPSGVEDSDIDHYFYGWEEPPSTRVDADALGGSATVHIAPPDEGRETLYVRSVDRAGHRSDVAKYVFLVKPGNGARAQWSFEGNAKDTAALGSRDGTIHGAAGYTRGPVGTALLLDGNRGSDMTAPNTVSTEASFSVSAWVRPDELRPGVMTAVGQEGGRFGNWSLDYRGDGAAGPRWSFQLLSGDPAAGQPDPGGVAATAKQKPQAGRWTHLTGVFDRQAMQLRLYVNGELAGQTQLPADFRPWASSSVVAVGRGQWAGQQVNHWRGAVDEVQVHGRAVAAVEVLGQVGRDNVPTGGWRFDDEDGAPASNELDGGRSGTLSGDARYVDSGLSGRAVELGGTGAVTTGEPAVRTDESFSVSAWVRPGAFPTGDQRPAMTAVSQDGTKNSGFYLQWNPYGGANGSWMFVRFSVDAPDAKWFGATATQTPRANQWTHLVGVYHAPTRELRIYVDGVFGDKTVVDENPTPWDATGSLVIGRGKVAGNPLDFWRGSIDEVRTYSRVLAPEEIVSMRIAHDTPAGVWALDGNAADSSGRGLNGTVSGTPQWTEGQSTDPDGRDKGLTLKGRPDSISTPHAIDTAESFTVSAWVRPDSAENCYCTILSQEGAFYSNFSLSQGADGKWSVAAERKEVSSGTTQGTWALGGKAQAGVWTHVAGVYDKPRQRLELYVNGVLVDAQPHVVTGPMKTDGRLQIGNVWWQGKAENFFKGAIDDVRIYTRPLFAEEIRAQAGRDVSLVHNWKFNETTGAAAADSIGARGGTTSGGATYGPALAGNAVRLDGIDDAVATSGVDLRTDQSFTVSALVYLDKEASTMDDCPSVCRSSAVTLDGGAGVMKLRLGHRIDHDQAPGPYGKWVFEMPEQGGRISEAAISVRESQFQQWVYLVGVYDASAKRLSLHVYAPGVEPDFDTGTLDVPWQAMGALRVGRGTVSGAAAEHWRGGVDDVRVYTGALPAERLESIYRSYPAP